MKVKVQSYPVKKLTLDGSIEVTEHYGVFTADDSIWSQDWKMVEVFYTQEEALSFAAKLKHPKVVEV